ncbi:sensor domain-containing diguanylate cyclase [Nocardia sp. NEAU-G5]|uniref:Sensor domain-containing diguanylate cyclase n=1 Tax=Nocardia albiluteola TaxID=2842303 RepID=A0ABS6B1R9_9NOCA|nr:sensor domain-containing diguanylate cyclase [Nocardia albiluteola]MBU3064251.1 sensor domain-containing diguanylate cyclase [Nocardia albiluteola]
MDGSERDALAAAWRQALTRIDEGPEASAQAGDLLAELVEDLLAGLVAEEFDADKGFGVGAAVAGAGWTDPEVPTLCARVLQPMVDHCDRPDAGARFAVLCAALGQGHQTRRAQARPDRARDPEPGLLEVNARFRVVFDNAAVAIAIGDTDGVLVEANRGLAEMIGVPVEQLRGISVYDFAHPDDQEEIRALVYENLVPAGQGTVKLERRLLRADQSVGWVAFSITYVQGMDGQDDYLLAVGEDVTEQHRLREELAWQARHDPLTGLPNRRYLVERIGEVTAAAGAEDYVGLCFVDLDRFKPINDTYGHGTGDRVLCQVAARFRDSITEPDCLIARIGGDEFVVLIPPPAGSYLVDQVADRILASLTEPITANGHRLRISATIGALVTPIAGSDAEELLDAADTVLYTAKADRKGHSVLRRSHASAR